MFVSPSSTALPAHSSNCELSYKRITLQSGALQSALSQLLEYKAEGRVKICSLYNDQHQATDMIKKNNKF